MHFDIAHSAAKARVQKAIIRKQIVLERGLHNRVKHILDQIAEVVVEHARHGVFDVEHVVGAYRGQLLKALSEHYTRVGQQFFDSVQESFYADKKSAPGPKETKGMAEEFWQAFHNWTSTQAAAKVKGIGDATTRYIRRMIRIRQDEGGSYREIADAIFDRSKNLNAGRAMRIARTETHVVSTYAMNEAVRSTRVKFDREWVSMADERTRVDHKKANGQRRAMDEPFDVGKEKLRFPGDPKGSAGTVINCRCVLLYHAARGRNVTWI